MPTGLIMRNGVALTGSDRDTSILDGGLTGSDSPAENFILFSSAIDDPRTRVSNLTVTGTHGILGGAFVVNGAAAGEISGNRIHDNFATDEGSAIRVGGDTAPEFLIKLNLIHHNFNSVGTSAHAVQLADTSAATLQNNTVAF